MSVVRLHPRSPDTHTRSALALAVSDSTEEATRPLLLSSIQNSSRVVLPLHLRSTSSLRVVTSFGLGPLGGNRIETPAQSADCPFQKPAGYGTQPRPNHTLVLFSHFRTYGDSNYFVYQQTTTKHGQSTVKYTLPIVLSTVTACPLLERGGSTPRYLPPSRRDRPC